MVLFSIICTRISIHHSGYNCMNRHRHTLIHSPFLSWKRKIKNKMLFGHKHRDMFNGFFLVIRCHPIVLLYLKCKSASIFSLFVLFSRISIFCVFRPLFSPFQTSKAKRLSYRTLIIKSNIHVIMYDFFLFRLVGVRATYVFVSISNYIGQKYCFFLLYVCV